MMRRCLPHKPSEEYFENLLRNYAADLGPQPGGWSALAYRVVSERETFFLKMYEKSRASTVKWTAAIDHYVPILIWLQHHSGLKGKIPVPLFTRSGEYKCEDEQGIYLLYEYIDGETIGEQHLTEHQVLKLAEMMAELHSYGEGQLSVADELKEDFDVPFLPELKDTLNQEQHLLPKDLWELIHPHVGNINELIDSLDKGSIRFTNSHVNRVLCHTDVHNWNLMQTEQELMLIDWEGLKLAPVEADLMFVVDKPYRELFMKHYCTFHPDFQMDADLLQFYQKRRKLEDIWEFMQQLLLDSQEEQDRRRTMTYLAKELQHMG